jgi:hypothetical protein
LGRRGTVRVGLAFLIASIMVISAFVVSASSVNAGKPSPPSADEQAFIAAIDDNYAWEMTERMVNGGPVVAGTASSANARTSRYTAGRRSAAPSP